MAALLLSQMFKLFLQFLLLLKEVEIGLLILDVQIIVEQNYFVLVDTLIILELFNNKWAFL